MNSLRGFLWFALLAISFLLWQAWMNDYVYKKPEVATATADDGQLPGTRSNTGDLPSNTQPTSPDTPTAASSTPVEQIDGQAAVMSAVQEPIVIETDVMKVRVSPYGGTVLSVDLKNYRQDANKPEPKIRLLDDQAATWFVAQSGLVTAQGSAPDHRAVYQAQSTRYELKDGDNEIAVPLSWQNEAGLKVTKTLVFRRGGYVIEEQLRIENGSGSTFQGNAYQQLQRNPGPPKSWSMTNPETYSFIGAAWFSNEKQFEKLAFADFIEEPLTRDIKGGWAAMLQHYFFAAWIPAGDETVHYETKVVKEAGVEHFLIRGVSPELKVEAGQTLTRSARLYAGPKLQNELKAIAPGLPYVIDYGKVTFISEPLFWLLDKLHKLSGNWGWAIILVVVILKLLLYPLSEMQYRSMAKLRKLQPRIEALKQRYGEDRQKFNQAMLELYQKEKANPASGCLPLLLTLPVFIALYWVLLESVELRHAPFMGWIHNLSARDPYFILPILNALTMWATQKLSPAPVGMDPIQQKILMYMPLALSLTFAFFPAGLVLYWTVNGALGLLQQWIIMKRYAKQEAKAA